MQHAITIPTPVRLGRDTKHREQSRHRLVESLWHKNGERRLPREIDLRRAIEACDPRDVWWVCEMNSYGPIYFLPTREWCVAIGRLFDELCIEIVLEVAAGDGFLAQCIKKIRPRLQVIATDSGRWQKPKARMSDEERNLYEHCAKGLTLGHHVERLCAQRAVEKYRPDLVVTSWAPPGLLVERMIRTGVRYILDIATDDDSCGNGAHTLRFVGEYRLGPLQTRALCRLDTKPSVERRSRVMLYYGKGFA